MGDFLDNLICFSCAKKLFLFLFFVLILNSSFAAVQTSFDLGLYFFDQGDSDLYPRCSGSVHSPRYWYTGVSYPVNMRIKAQTLLYIDDILYLNGNNTPLFNAQNCSPNCNGGTCFTGFIDPNTVSNVTLPAWTQLTFKLVDTKGSVSAAWGVINLYPDCTLPKAPCGAASCCEPNKCIIGSTGGSFCCNTGNTDGYTCCSTGSACSVDRTTGAIVNRYSGGPDPFLVSSTCCNNSTCVAERIFTSSTNFYYRATCITDDTSVSSHFTCIGDSCVRVSGSGVNTCSSNSDCISGSTHKTCVGSSCVNVNGPGLNLCASDLQCLSMHKVCADGSCIPIFGPGTNECSNDLQCKQNYTICDFDTGTCVLVEGSGLNACILGDPNACKTPPTHLACDTLGKCVIFPGPGTNTCSSDNNCNSKITTSHLACNSNHLCVRVSGAGGNTCDNNSQCINTHKECSSNGYCLPFPNTPGNSTDLCSNDSVCPKWTSDCSNGICTSFYRSTRDFNSCSSNADCCFRKNCSNYPDQCGNDFNDGCGGMLTCVCPLGKTCFFGKCVLNDYFCLGPDPENSLLCPGDNLNLDWNYLKSLVGGSDSNCTVQKKCEYFCAPGFDFNGSACVKSSFVCLGNSSFDFNHSSLVVGDDVGLSVDTNSKLVDVNSSDKCEFVCDSGFDFNGSACVASTNYSCLGSVSLNSVLCPGDAGGLDKNYDRVLVGSCSSPSGSVPKCEYFCAPGFDFNGSACVLPTCVSRDCAWYKSNWGYDCGQNLDNNCGGKINCSCNTGLTCLSNSCFLVGSINSIIQFNATFDPESMAIKFNDRCLLSVFDANVTLFEETTGWNKLLVNKNCEANGSSFDYADANIPINKILKLTLRINEPCSTCEKIVILDTAVTTLSTRSIPDINPIVLLIVSIIVVIILSPRDR